jgi:hypothetical protein
MSSHYSVVCPPKIEMSACYQIRNVRFVVIKYQGVSQRVGWLNQTLRDGDGSPRGNEVPVEETLTWPRVVDRSFSRGDRDRFLASRQTT